MPIAREPSGFQPPTLKYKKTKYAQSGNPNLPRQYGIWAFCGGRGSGKTYTCCQLLKAFEKDPPRNEDGTLQAIRIIVISPT